MFTESVAKDTAQRPIWYFVRTSNLSGDIFAIRNNATGRYLTETFGNIRNMERSPGTGANYLDWQSWQLIAQTDGTYRIRSVSDPTLYITQPGGGGHLTLETLITGGGSHRQGWRIERIWHSYPNFTHVGFWDGDIAIRIRPVGAQPSGFNFEQRMGTARHAWGPTLGVTFNEVTNMADANIRAYGGSRREVQHALERRNSFPRNAEGWSYAPGFHSPPAYTIQAGGRTRYVHRFTGTGADAHRMAVFTGHNHLATGTAIHELAHVLGYNGHSPGVNDIMRPEAETSINETVLFPAEIEHLRQIYRMFRR